MVTSIEEAKRQQPAQRLGQIVISALVVLALALAVLVNLAAPWLAWRWAGQPFMGVLLEHTLVISPTQGHSPPPEGLTYPRRVLAADGQPVHNQAELGRILEAAGLGQTVTYTLECEDEAGGWQECSVAVPVTSFPPRELVTLFWVPYFIGLVYLAAGLGVYWLRGGTGGGQAFAFFCAFLSIVTGLFFDMVTNHWFVRLWTASMSVLAASVIHLALVFPEERPSIKRYPLLRFLPYLPALVLIVLSQSSLFDPGDPRAYFVFWRWNYIYIGLGVFCLLALIVHARLQPSSDVVRQQARIILLGSVLAFAPATIWFVLASLQINVYFRTELYFPPLILFPISVAYAILRYRLLDVNLVISRGLVYSVLTVIVTGFYFLLVNIVGQLFRIASPASNPILMAVLVLILALGLNPLKDRLQRAVDNVFYKDRLDYRQVLQDFSRALTATLELPVLFEMLLTRLAALFHTERAIIFMREEDSEAYVAQQVIGMAEGAARSIRFDKSNQTLRWLIDKGQPFYLEGEEGQTYPPNLPGEERARFLALNTPLFIPFQAKGRLIGWLALGSKRSGDLYSRDDLTFLTTLADQTSIALENARLYKRTEERARELATLIEVGQTLASTLDLQTVLDSIMNKVADLLDVEAASLLLMNEEGTELVFQVALSPFGEDFESIRVPVGTGIAGTVAAQGEPLIVNDVQRDPRFWIKVDETTSFSTKSILCVPLISRKRVIGVIEAINKRGGDSFNEEEAKLLSSFAAQAAIAIENAQLYTMTDQALAKRVQELSTLQEIDRQLNATLDFERVMNLALDWALVTTAADTGALAVVDREQNGMWILVQRGYSEEYGRYRTELWPLDRGVMGRVVRTGKPALIPDVFQDPDYFHAVTTTRSQLTVPVLREEQAVGVINLESPEPAGFSQEDLNFLMRLADHAAIAIENAKLYADVKRANEAKSEFVSIVSHELKIPMTSIKGYARLLELGAAGEMSETQREFVHTIISNVDRMDTLVKDLLEISRIETGRLKLDREPVVIHAVVNEAVQVVQGEIEAKNLTLTLNLPEDLPLVWGDQTRLIQVMNNLLSNAYKYTPEGGHITVESRTIVEPPPSSEDGEESPFVLVSVADTGVGIPPEDRHKIFTKFFRADHPEVQKVPGTGLGLSITKSIVEVHGGRIWVESEPEQGSTFYFTLPAVAV